MQTRYKQRRFKSSELLKDELNNKQKTNYNEFSKQVKVLLCEV